MLKNKIYRNGVAIGLLLMAATVFVNFFNALSLPQIAQHASEIIGRKAEISESTANKPEALSPEELDDLYRREHIGVYVFQHDSLVQWNNSALPLKEAPAVFQKKHGLIRLKHGHYLYFRSDSLQRVVLVLTLVKPLYELQNKYLSNDFAAWTGIPKEIDMEVAGDKQTEVKLGEEVLFSLKGTENLYYESAFDKMCYGIFLVGFISVLISVIGFAKKGLSARITGLILLLIGILRVTMLINRWPGYFYRTPLYDVRLFGNAGSFFNAYLGDLLLNSLTILFAAACLHFYFQNALKNKRRYFAELTLFTALLFVTVNAFNHSVISLVANSTLNFDFLNVFNVKFSALVGLAALCMYSLALFIISFRLVNAFKGSFAGFFKFLVLHVVVCVLLWFAFDANDHFFESGWLLIFSGAMYLFLLLGRLSISLLLGLQIVLMTGITSKFLTKMIDKSQKQELEILSFKLSERQDPILESEFNSLPQKMAADENLANLIQILPVSVEGVESLIKQKYFSGYFDRYNLDFSLFDKNCHPELPVKQSLLVNQGYFEDEIRLRSEPTRVDGLFFAEKYQKNTRYIARIPLGEKNLYVMLEAKQFEELGSFPDLLLDRSQQKNEKLQTLSHAVYRSQQLTGHYGELNYPFFLQDSATFCSSHPEYVSNYFDADDNTVVIISEPSKTWNYFFTFNSYLLLFFSLITYASYLLYASVFTGQFSTPSLTRRIQTIIIGLLLLAMSAIGFTSGNLVTDQFDRDNNKLLEEKTQVIISELSTQFSPKQFFDESRKELINVKLKEYSRLFNTPISLFDKRGQLYNTSESKLYDFGLAARFANPAAYRNLTNNHSSAESVMEQAGALTYQSFYTPLYDGKKELLGFVNLPYFAKQSALAKELSGIISALINVYVILFVISILAALILAGYITQPLRLIQQQIAKITLGKQNEKISWRSNDEIGRLVAEYNQMLVKLENSANLLAKSERESAWREMAKQVAHEIKNPLTPMKLNLQYLLHVMKEEPGDFREKFEKTSKGIIEQIDSLANIATEFSNFAKLPATQLRAIDLTEVISTSVLLFENQKNIIISNLIPPMPLLVKGDRDQCLRVFNNLLKNAVQALDNTAEPKIHITCEQEAGTVTISLYDNGCGIDEELKKRLFTPNFTTKSTGSGLGLAMVKNIMEGCGGRIWFESETGKGTAFFVNFIKME